MSLRAATWVCVQDKQLVTKRMRVELSDLLSFFFFNLLPNDRVVDRPFTLHTSITAAQIHFNKLLYNYLFPFKNCLRHCARVTDKRPMAPFAFYFVIITEEKKVAVGASFVLLFLLSCYFFFSTLDQSRTKWRNKWIPSRSKRCEKKRREGGDLSVAPFLLIVTRMRPVNNDET